MMTASRRHPKSLLESMVRRQPFAPSKLYVVRRPVGCT